MSKISEFRNIYCCKIVSFPSICNKRQHCRLVMFDEKILLMFSKKPTEPGYDESKVKYIIGNVGNLCLGISQLFINHIDCVL